MVAFGVFDRLHAGHHHFLSKAVTVGEQLVVIVTRDNTVKSLKKRDPWQKEEERCRAIREYDENILTILGDEKPGDYDLLRRTKPSYTSIILGYDQAGLEADLNERMEKGELPRYPLIKLDAFEPDKYHTSILYPRNPPVEQEGVLVASL